jgi:hypothetical protein
VLIMGIPSHAFRTVLTRVASSAEPWIPVVSLAVAGRG